jgi:hypothetical protein
MSTQESFTTGKRRQRAYQPRTPSELLISLNRQHPKKSREEIVDLFANILPSYEEPQRIVNKDWASLNLNRLTHADPTREERRAKAKTEAKADSEEVMTKVKKNMTRLVLLETKMPNGKAYRDCTREDLEQMGGEMSAMIVTLKPGQRVGDVYKSNEELPR